MKCPPGQAASTAAPGRASQKRWVYRIARSMHAFYVAPMGGITGTGTGCHATSRRASSARTSAPQNVTWTAGPFSPLTINVHSLTPEFAFLTY